MDSGDYVINTACVVADYFNYRIQKEGYDWQVSPTRNCPNNKVNIAVRKLCQEFEAKYGKQFQEMCHTCATLGLERDSYVEVLNQLLEVDGLNWGRVIAIFAFGGQMCLNSMANNCPNEVDFVREWTYSFMHKNVDQWIRENGGWVGTFINNYL